MSQPKLADFVHSSGATSDVQLELLLEPEEGKRLSPEDDIEQLQTKYHELYSNYQQKARRIYHLEQALDQALVCLDEIRSRAQAQNHLLEKLDSAEDFIFVQHQAIERLKQDLAQQQQENRSLELSLHRNQAIVTQQNKELATLHQETALAQNKVEELGSGLKRQIKALAKWQQRHEELQAEHDHRQSRLSELEQRTAEMQEQILGQARQAGEYEAAVQYWKERCLVYQRQATQIREIVSQNLDDHANAEDSPLSQCLSELLSLLQVMTMPEDEENQPLSVIPSPRFATLDVPEFLLRRRNYRNLG